jgi:dehydrogenase/reductase SDR family member 7B
LNRIKRIRRYFFNNVVWITGASSGIGRGLAIECARAGAKLIISARRSDKLEELAAEIRTIPACPSISVLAFDVTDHQAVKQNTEEAASIHGRIDVLINNAGISQRSLIKDLSYEVIEKIIKTDLLAVTDLTLAVLNYMYRDQAGHIVVTSSLMGKIGTPYRSAYCAAKHGLHGFFSSLAAEARTDNIAVTMLIPGRVKTNISYHALNGQAEEHGIMDSGLSQGVSVEKIAPRILAAIAKRKLEYRFALSPLMHIGLLLAKTAPRLYLFLLSKVKVT